MKLFVVGFFSGVLWLGAAVFCWYDFKSNCADWLKLAGNAPNVERADEYLGLAIEYMVTHGYTNGNAAFLFRTPDSDVGIWYSQISGAKATTEDLLSRVQAGEEVSQLEKDNALMKIREVVLEQSRKGTKVSTPGKTDWFPAQRIMLGWLILSVALCTIGVLLGDLE